MIDVDRYGPYRGLEAVLAAADALAAEHPDRIERIEYGASVEGRPLIAYRLVRPLERPRVACLYVAGIHAMEWIGVETLIALLDGAARRMDAEQLPGRSIHLRADRQPRRVPPRGAGPSGRAVVASHGRTPTGST